jgi:hypothetical protein
MKLLALLAIVALIPIVVGEVRDVFVWLAPRIVKWSARRLPHEHAVIREEEWLAHLDERTSGLKLAKLLYALSFCIAAARIRIQLWNGVDSSYAEFWLPSDENSPPAPEQMILGRNSVLLYQGCLGIKVHHNGVTYHLPWAAIDHAHPNLQSPVETGPIPAIVHRYASVLWDLEFNMEDDTRWPPAGHGRIFSYAKDWAHITLILTVLLVAVVTAPVWGSVKMLKVSYARLRYGRVVVYVFQDGQRRRLTRKERSGTRGEP